MILTHTGKFGDFIPTLTISNYYWKNNSEKTTFILTKWFENINGLEEFLMLQDFTENVIFDSFKVDNFDLGGQPYKFKPESITNELYYNLGMWTFPNIYLGELYANEYNLKYDKDIHLKFIDDNFPDELKEQINYTHFYDDRWDKDRYVQTFTKNLPNSGAIAFNPKKSLLHNLNLAYYAKNNIFYPNGFSGLVDMCGIKMELINGSVNPNVYYINIK
jgi:hypothetical protein